MKINFLAAALIVISLQMYSQSNFSIGLGLSEQFIGKDTGVNIPQGFVTYNFTTDISLSLVGSNAVMEAKGTDIDYSLNTYGIQVGYAFGKSEKTKFESVFGFSYLMFDKDLALEDDNGLGIDLGFQLFLRNDKKLNFGVRLIGTYSEISPGGILNVGVVMRYRL